MPTNDDTRNAALQAGNAIDLRREFPGAGKGDVEADCAAFAQALTLERRPGVGFWIKLTGNWNLSGRDWSGAIDKHSVVIFGEGVWQTIVRYEPVGNGKLFSFYRNGSQNFCGLHDLAIESRTVSDDVRVVGLEVLSNFHFNCSNVVTHMTNAGSVGLSLGGREGAAFSRLYLKAATPQMLVRNPDRDDFSAPLDNNETVVENSIFACMVSGRNKSVVHVEKGANTTGLRYRGVSMVSGVNGILDIDGGVSSGMNSHKLVLEDTHWEQPETESGYFVRIHRTGSRLNGLEARGCWSSANFLQVYGVDQIDLSAPELRKANSIFVYAPQGVNGVSGIDALSWRNLFAPHGGSVNLYGMTKDFSTQRIGGTDARPLFRSAEYSRTVQE